MSKSPGPNQIHAKLLYELREETVGPVTKLFNWSLRRGTVPQEWKNAHVTPLHKKPVRLNVKITDLVSLTSIVGKLLESIIKDNIFKHLEILKLIRTSQHGFMKGKSCLTNLLEFF